MSNIIIENMRTKDIRPPPCEIEYKNMKFLITDRPTDQTIQHYIQQVNLTTVRKIGPWLQELKKHKVRDVVRVCEPTYKVDELSTEGISVTDLAYDDGTSPPSEVVDEWFELLKKRFKEEPEACVAVHCVAGLGRAPVLVALALIELGMRYEDAVELIRQKRRGAINAKQLQFLEKYRPKSRLKLRNGHKNSCTIQ
ncbi:PRL-1 phosphatase isoform X1 [Homalodisca vitripennis]|uniref:Protein tyrosine phosphatase type IVA 3 n=1 Tax=Homalodisca liturata TaxID=320908 RepID=A0A1B6HDF7_9HEMI|nr:PRL-1 phosphatase isoform X1 [Homalodisca vitripennis]XP_046672123.1 PRL-1 phosphatase isoform X1 [Homalodisca vitripennis]